MDNVEELVGAWSNSAPGIKLGMPDRDVMLLPGMTQRDRVRPTEFIDGGFRWFFADKSIFFSRLANGYRVTEIIYHRNWRDDGRRNCKTN